MDHNSCPSLRGSHCLSGRKKSDHECMSLHQLPNQAPQKNNRSTFPILCCRISEGMIPIPTITDVLEKCTTPSIDSHDTFHLSTVSSLSRSDNVEPRQSIPRLYEKPAKSSILSQLTLSWLGVLHQQTNAQLKTSPAHYKPVVNWNV